MHTVRSSRTWLSWIGRLSLCTSHPLCPFASTGSSARVDSSSWKQRLVLSMPGTPESRTARCQCPRPCCSVFNVPTTTHTLFLLGFDMFVLPTCESRLPLGRDAALPVVVNCRCPLVVVARDEPDANLFARSFFCAHSFGRHSFWQVFLATTDTLRVGGPEVLGTGRNLGHQTRLDLGL